MSMLPGWAITVLAAVAPAMVATALLLVANRRRGFPAAAFLALATLLSILRCVAYAAELASTTPEQATAWDAAGATLLLPILLLLGGSTLFFVKLSWKPGWGFLAATLAVVAHSALPWLPPAELWREPTRWLVAENGGFLAYGNGVLRLGWLSCAALLAAYSVGLVAWHRSRVHLAFRSRVDRYLAGTLVVVLMLVLEAQRDSVPISATPWLLALGLSLTMMAALKGNALDVMPLARDEAFDHMGDGLIVVDPLSRVVDINPAAALLFGVKSERVVGKKLADLAFGADLQDLVGLEGAHEIEIWELGKERTLRASVRRIPMQGGRSTGAVIVLNDISERKRLEKSLTETSDDLVVALHETERLAHEAQQANDAKSRYLATISHEIRTPLNGLIGITELLQRTNLTPEQREHALMIQSCGQSLLRLVGNVLDISKIEAGRMTLESVEFDLAALIQEVADQHRVVAAQKGVGVQLQLPPAALPMVFGDPMRIRQVLHNLLSNAVRFTERGWVRVYLERKASETGTLEVVIAVADTGIGIEPDRLHTIFEDYEQADSTISRRFGGTGLGLSITKQLVDLMGGRIAVRSKLGEGSTFLVDLKLRAALTPPVPTTPWPAFSQEASPAVAEAPKEVGPPRTADPPASRPVIAKASKRAFPGIRVLVAEDDEVSTLVVSGQLEFLGCEYQVARDGMQAVRLARSEVFDLVFMDMHMPVMGGLDATRELRASGFPTPIVAMTASVLDEDVNECLAAGMNAVVSKPISADAIAGVLSQFVHVRSQS